MKKFLLILLVLVLSLSVVACGKETESDSSKKSDKPTKSKGVSEEVLSASKFDSVMQIDKTVLHMPFTFQDVLDADATIQDSEYTADYMMASDDKVYVKFAIGDGLIRMAFHNDSDATCSLKDATLISSIGYGIETNSSSIYFAGGIHVGNTLSELQSAWGTADGEQSTDSSFIYSYIEYPDNGQFGGGNQFNIQIDRNTAKITSIGLVHTPKIDEIIDISYNFKHQQRNFDLIVPIPYYAYYISMIKGFTIESIDGVDYMVTYPTYADLKVLSKDVDYSATEESLNSVLTVSNYLSITDPIEQTVILKNDEQVGIICAFYTSSETGNYTCRTYVVGREVEYCSYFEHSIYSRNGEAISDNGKKYFVDYMKELMSGCNYIINSK